MNGDACRTNFDGRLMTAVLPAEGATLATSLSRGLMLVAHTGNAHLAVHVDRPLLRGLARAQGTADRAFYGHWAREQGTGSTAAAPPDDAGVAFADLPEAIPFRHATSHTFTVIDTDIHLILHATRDPVWPDVHVELRMSRLLIKRLSRYQHRLHRKARIAALVGFLVAVGAFVSLVAFVA